VQYATWAADGQGVDRHFFGLKNMLREGEDVPDIYKDPAFSRTNHWELSTSQLSSKFVDGWGYGEGVSAYLICLGVTSGCAVRYRPTFAR
jgi:carnitine O-acetyltransferase